MANDHQSNYLHIPVLICTLIFWKRGESLFLSFLVPTDSWCLLGHPGQELTAGIPRIRGQLLVLEGCASGVCGGSLSYVGRRSWQTVPSKCAVVVVGMSIARLSLAP